MEIREAWGRSLEVSWRVMSIFCIRDVRRALRACVDYILGDDRWVLRGATLLL
jgi:hypothetical protein